MISVLETFGFGSVVIVTTVWCPGEGTCPEYPEKNIFKYLTCSRHQKRNQKFSNSPIHELKVLHRGQWAFKTSFYSCIISSLLLVIKDKPCFFILKRFCSTLNSGIGELKKSWFRFLKSRTGYNRQFDFDFKKLGLFKKGCYKKYIPLIIKKVFVLE